MIGKAGINGHKRLLEFASQFWNIVFVKELTQHVLGMQTLAFPEEKQHSPSPDSFARVQNEMRFFQSDKRG